MAAESYRRLGDERRQAVALLTIPDDDPALVEEGLGLCRAAAGRYGVLDGPAWLDRPLAAALPPADRARLRGDLGDLLVLWARALTRRAAAEEGRPRSLDLEEAASTARPGRGLLRARRRAPGAAAGPRRPGAARRRGATRRSAGSARRPRPSPCGPAASGSWSTRIGSTPTSAAGSLSDARRSPRTTRRTSRPGSPSATGTPGSAGPSEALTDYNVAVAMAPRLYWTHFNRGLHHLEMKDYSRALEDFDRVVERRPDLPSAFLNRALARLGLGDARGAVDDLTRCLALEGAPTRAWFIRARARQRLGDRQGARLDREQGLKRRPGDPAGFVARGLARLPGDLAGAIADFDAALAIDPRYRHALQDKASVLSENLGQPEQAVRLLDVAVDAHPDFVEALAGRAVLLARLGRRDAALRDARAALALDDGALTVYQAACVYALTSRQEPADRAEALRLLAEAVRKDGSWLAVAREDRDLDPIRDRPAFRELLEALEVVRRAGTAR